MELVPVDPNSQVYKDLMAVNQANTNPGVSETKKLIPVDPSSAEYRAIMSGQDLQQRTQPPGAPNEARVQQVQQQLAGKPRPMGGAPDINIDFKTGKAKLEPPVEGGSYGLAAALLTPTSRIPAAIGGAVTSAAEDIGKGKMPSPTGMAVGAAGGFASPEIAKAGKALLRGAGGIFGRGPLKEAGSKIYEETKAITKPTATTETENEIMQQISTFGRTAPRQQVAAVEDVFNKIANAKASGKPLTYGEVFNNVTQLNQEVHQLYQGKAKQAAGQLEKLSGKMMEDLAASGPEAQAAVDSYKRAVGMFGGYGGVVQAVKKITGLGVGAGTALAAALKPGTMYASAPAALLGGIVNLSERLPFGVGQGIARALIEDPGKLSQGAVRALVGAINSGVKEKEVY